MKRNRRNEEHMTIVIMNEAKRLTRQDAEAHGKTKQQFHKETEQLLNKSNHQNKRFSGMYALAHLDEIHLHEDFHKYMNIGSKHSKA